MFKIIYLILQKPKRYLAQKAWIVTNLKGSSDSYRKATAQTDTPRALCDLLVNLVTCISAAFNKLDNSTSCT